MMKIQRTLCIVTLLVCAHACSGAVGDDLYLALKTGNIEIVQQHLDRGIDPNENVETLVGAGDNEKLWSGPPLLVAILSRQDEVGKILVENGAQWEQLESKLLTTAMMAAIQQGMHETVRAIAISQPLTENGKAQIEAAIGFAASIGNLEFVQDLIRINESRNDHSEIQLDKPLLLAAASGHEDVVRALIERQPEHSQRTELLVASVAGSNVGLVEYFLMGFDVEAVGDGAKSDLIEAVTNRLERRPGDKNGEFVALALADWGLEFCSAEVSKSEMSKFTQNVLRIANSKCNGVSASK